MHHRTQGDTALLCPVARPALAALAAWSPLPHAACDLIAWVAALRGAAVESGPPGTKRHITHSEEEL